MGVLLKMADHSSRPRKRRHNDPLDSPLVRAARKLIRNAASKAIDAHQDTTSTEGAIAAGAYAQGLADALVLLEWVAVELAKKPQP